MGKVTHGVHSFLANARLPSRIRGKKKIIEAVEGFKKKTIEDLGGWDAMTGQQRTLVEVTYEALMVIQLSMLYLKKLRLPIRPDLATKGIVEMQPILSRNFVSYLNVIRQNLIALGLESKTADSYMSPLERAIEKYGPD